MSVNASQEVWRVDVWIHLNPRCVLTVEWQSESQLQAADVCSPVQVSAVSYLLFCSAEEGRQEVERPLWRRLRCVLQYKLKQDDKHFSLMDSLVFERLVGGGEAAGRHGDGDDVVELVLSDPPGGVVFSCVQVCAAAGWEETEKTDWQTDLMIKRV